ncbi:MAG: RHS repeat protein [Acidobacteria bacterium]|nr:RHS repeat protein [Acidobacteriota bacterium]
MTGVTQTAAVEMQYDNLGNRTEMTDGLGTQTYEYDELSRLTAESRDFSDTLPDEPSGGLFTLTYTYEIGGQLRSYTDPWGKQISYTHDKAARIVSVAGTPHGGVSSYATNAQYRAWGGLKHLEYGNGVIADSTYDSTLRPATFDLQKPGDDPIMEKSYQYYNDGRLKHIDDALQGKFDRLQTYDFAGRVKEGLSSTEANGVPVTTDQNLNLPYRQSFSYDAFNNMTQRNNLHWGTDTWQGESNNLNYTFTNNRIAGFQYDADGRILQSAAPERATDYTYDARGLMTRGLGSTTFGETDIERTYSGDGRELKRKKKVYEYNEDPEPELEWITRPDAYYIRSTVFGGEVISETHETGSKLRTFVYAAGIKIATQIGHSHPNKWVVFSHHDAAGMSHRGTYQWGNAIQDDAGLEDGPAELDPMGNNAGLKTPYVEPEPPPEPPPIPIPPFDGDSPMFVNGQAVRATLDGVSVPWNVLQSMANAGGLTHMGLPVDVRVGQMVIPRIVEGPNPNRWEDPRMAMVMRYEGDWVISVAHLQVGTKERLKEKDQRRYDEKRRKLIERFANISSKCKDFLKAAGYTAEEVIEAINLQQAYDGTTSTISISAAGIINEGSWAPGSTEKQRQEFRDIQMNVYFRNNRGTRAATGTQPFGVGGGTVAERSDVYFRPDRGWFGIYRGRTGLTESTILHEALHSLSGLGDADLYTKLTGKIAASHGEASMGISAALRENDCVK